MLAELPVRRAFPVKSPLLIPAKLLYLFRNLFLPLPVLFRQALSSCDLSDPGSLQKSQAVHQIDDR